MSTHFHNPILEAHVARALAQHHAVNVTVHVRLDGTVRITGKIPNGADLQQIKHDVNLIPGVTHIFFNVARQPD